jgi:hypothetical protein
VASPLSLPANGRAAAAALFLKPAKCNAADGDKKPLFHIEPVEEVDASRCKVRT